MPGVSVMVELRRRVNAVSTAAAAAEAPDIIDDDEASAWTVALLTDLPRVVEYMCALVVPSAGSFLGVLMTPPALVTRCDDDGSGEKVEEAKADDDSAEEGQLLGTGPEGSITGKGARTGLRTYASGVNVVVHPAAPLVRPIALGVSPIEEL